MEFSPEYFDYRPIFSSEEKQYLRALSKQYSLEQFVSDHQTFEERSIYYAFVSSKIEGNQYSKKGATLLLKYGFTENGKTMQDAMMLINLRDAFVDVTLSSDEKIESVLTKHYVCTIHSKVSDKILQSHDRGQVRRNYVTISGSDYVPLDNPYLLEEQLQRLLDVALTINDPFEQAVFAHSNLAYLQYFKDCNKRTARLVQTAIMAAHKVTPIFLREGAVQGYLISLLNYYETGDFKQYKELFLTEYEHTIKQLQGVAPEQLEAQSKALKKILAAR